jgi:hypothetical protein
MRKDPEDFKPLKPFSLKASIEGVYKGFQEFWKPFSKIEPRKQVDFAAGVYAQMQLNNPGLMFAGAASFIVTNIYAQMDATPFFKFMPAPAYNQIVNGTLTVFKELGPSFTCLAIAPRHNWNALDVVKKILKKEEGKIEAYRYAGLDYAAINKPLLHAKMTLMNEQYNTLQPLLYTAFYQQLGYLFTSKFEIIKQEVVFSSRPTERSTTLTVYPKAFSGPSYNFLSPSQRYEFGSNVLKTYFNLCKHEPEYVVSELEEIRDRGKAAHPVLWNLFVEPVLPTRRREDVVKDFKDLFSQVEDEE